MAERPWVQPEEVKAYTEHKEVKARPDQKLLVDIARAEAKVIKITNNTFEDDEKYPVIPRNVALATMLIAEAYAKNSVVSVKGKLKSETFDDYAYTAETLEIDVDNLDLDELLHEYVITGTGGDLNVEMFIL